MSKNPESLLNIKNKNSISQSTIKSGILFLEEKVNQFIIDEEKNFTDLENELSKIIQVNDELWSVTEKLAPKVDHFAKKICEDTNEFQSKFLHYFDDAFQQLQILISNRKSEIESLDGFKKKLSFKIDEIHGELKALHHKRDIHYRTLNTAITAELHEIRDAILSEQKARKVAEVALFKMVEKVQRTASQSLAVETRTRCQTEEQIFKYLESSCAKIEDALSSGLVKNIVNEDALHISPKKSIDQVSDDSTCFRSSEMNVSSGRSTCKNFFVSQSSLFDTEVINEKFNVMSDDIGINKNSYVHQFRSNVDTFPDFKSISTENNSIDNAFSVSNLKVVVPKYEFPNKNDLYDDSLMHTTKKSESGSVQLTRISDSDAEIDFSTITHLQDSSLCDDLKTLTISNDEIFQLGNKKIEEREHNKILTKNDGITDENHGDNNALFSFLQKNRISTIYKSPENIDLNGINNKNNTISEHNNNENQTLNGSSEFENTHEKNLFPTINDNIFQKEFKNHQNMRSDISSSLHQFNKVDKLNYEQFKSVLNKNSVGSKFPENKHNDRSVSRVTKNIFDNGNVYDISQGSKKFDVYLNFNEDYEMGIKSNVLELEKSEKSKERKSSILDQLDHNNNKEEKNQEHEKDNENDDDDAEGYSNDDDSDAEDNSNDNDDEDSDNDEELEKAYYTDIKLQSVANEEKVENLLHRIGESYKKRQTN